MADEAYDIDALIEAVVDGRFVDWAQAMRDAPAAVRPRVRDLQAIVSICHDRKAPLAAAPSQSGRPAEDGTADASTLGTWGHLRVLAHLGSGAYGDVYTAYDPVLERDVALKLLPAGDANLSARAIGEARHLARVRHPQVVTVHGAAVHEGTVGIWMECISGRTLAEIVEQDGALSIGHAVAIAVSVCRALGAVHAAGLVHGDVKAQNVMRDDAGRVVLMDFGTGRDVRLAGGPVAGTPRYLAPEVRDGASPSVASDIYALGVLVHYITTGTFDDDAVPRGVGRAPAARLRHVLRRATDASAEGRWRSAEAFATALQQAAPPPPPRARVARGAMALVAVACGLAAVWLALASAGARQERPRVSTSQVETIHLPPDVVPGDWLAENGEMQATWMPEPLVSRNAFTSQRRTWIDRMEPGVELEGAVIAPDGRRIAFVAVRPREERSQVRVVDDGGEVHTLVADDDVAAAKIGPWAGDRLPVLRSRTDGTRDVAILDTRLGGVRDVVPLSRDPAGFSLSPDGRMLVYDASEARGSTWRRDIRLHDLRTGADVALVATPADERLPTWTPSGAALLYVTTTGTTTRLVLLPMASSGASSAAQVLLETRDALRPAGFDSSGNAFVLSEPGRVDVVISDFAAAEAGKPRETKVSRDEQAIWPHWSTTNALLWSGRRGWGAYDLVIHDVATGRQRVLAGTLDAFMFARWSPDGSRIAGWGVDPRTRTLQVIDVHTGVVRELTRRPHPEFGSAWGLAWGGTGEELLLQEDNETVTVLHVTTGATRRLKTPAAFGALRHGVALARDGRTLAAVARNDGGLEKLVLFGKAVRTRELWSAPSAAQIRLVGWLGDGSSVFVTQQAPLPHYQMSRELWRIPLRGAAPVWTGVRAFSMWYVTVNASGTRAAYSTGSSTRTLLLVTLPTQGG